MCLTATRLARTSEFAESISASAREKPRFRPIVGQKPPPCEGKPNALLRDRLRAVPLGEVDAHAQHPEPQDKGGQPSEQ